MVFVNSQKFACESCIKGHRSSLCHHTDRPLFEIKKKGRPLSQCEKCRELRQSRKVHSKCNCNPKDDNATRGQLSTPTKSRRFIPIVPALPNGLKDILKAAHDPSAVPADSRQRVDSLLNPCNCKNVWKCKCRTPTHSATSPVRGANPLPEANLTTLARAAEICYNNDAITVPRTPARSSLRPGKQIQNSKRHTSRATTTNSTHKRPKHSTTRPPSHRPPGPDLPPILPTTPSSPQLQRADLIPSFPTLPSMSAMTSLAGSGCTCGLQCSCPGCVEHRGHDHAAKDRRNCADGCGTCVDRRAGVALPSDEHHSVSNIGIIDQFFARAATLPAPPTNRTGFQLDPMNMTVYPIAARETEECGLVFGLVNLPKLKCCGGRCGCSKGRCGCGKLCSGSCTEHGGQSVDDDMADVPVSIEAPASVVQESSASPQLQPVVPAMQSCCAGKVAARTA